jgi:hypothetical protein
MQTGRLTAIGSRGFLLLALIGFIPAALFAVDETDAEDPFDPKRPLAAELEASVPDGFALAAVGDCIISRPLSQKRSRDAAFDGAVEILSGADATFGNLETSILDVRTFEGHPDTGEDDWGLTSVPAVAEDLAAMGFDLLGRANNHALDWGIAGMRETSRWLDAAGLVHAGVGENRGLARAPRYFESEQGRIALVSMASSYNASTAATPAHGSTSGRPGLNALRVERFTIVPPETMRALAGIDRSMREARGKTSEAKDDPPAELTLLETEFRLGAPGQAALGSLDRLDPRPRAGLRRGGARRLPEGAGAPGDRRGRRRLPRPRHPSPRADRGVRG